MTDARNARPIVAAATVPERLRRPIHFGALLGLSTGLYATALAGVAIFQQHADDDLSAARAPAVARAAELRAANDRLAAAIEDLGGSETRALRGFGIIRTDIDDVHLALDELADLVGDVRGAAAELPQRIVLPAVPNPGSVRVRTKAPATHATTGASGG